MGKVILADSTTQAAAVSSQPAGQIQIRRIYLKATAMRQPNTPQILSVMEVSPVDVEMKVNVMAAQLEGRSYEVTLGAFVAARLGEQTVYEVEAQQAGIFDLAGLQEEQLSAALGIDCARVLLSYLRYHLADTITHAGFMPLHLGDVDFVPLALPQPGGDPVVELPTGDERKR